MTMKALETAFGAFAFAVLLYGIVFLGACL
jgi:hypothetical protein